MSWEEMRLLLGAQMKDNSGETHPVKIHKNAQFIVETANTIPTGDGKTDVGENHLPAENPTEYKWINFTQGTRGQVSATATLPENSFKVGDRVRIFWVEEYASGNEAASANMLVISPNRFPGTLTYNIQGSLTGNKKMSNQFSELLELLRAWLATTYVWNYDEVWMLENNQDWTISNQDPNRVRLND